MTEQHEQPGNWFSRLQEKVAGGSALTDLLNTRLESIDDCYDFLDAGLPLKHTPPTFAQVQRAYRSQLWRYDPSRTDLSQEAIEYRTLKTAKTKEAYEYICKQLGKDPYQGLEETEEGLIAERDFLLEGWKDWWCGTPAMHIADEYTERIEALKNRLEKNEQ